MARIETHTERRSEIRTLLHAGMSDARQAADDVVPVAVVDELVLSVVLKNGDATDRTPQTGRRGLRRVGAHLPHVPTDLHREDGDAPGTKRRRCQKGTTVHIFECSGLKKKPT